MTTNPSSFRLRRLRCWVTIALLAYVVPTVGGCINPSLPFDVALNLSAAPRWPEAQADPERPTLVVLQHGLMRSWASLWRLERALEAHGYEVLNASYPSTQGLIEDHAQLLHDQLEARLLERGGPVPRLCFVGHSLGGLVIRAYLSRDDARAVDSCVFIGTPHRGAALADARKRLFVFRLFLGSKAALQLSPSDPIYDRLDPVRCRKVGTIAGGRGTAEGWNDDVPGDDDGTVGVAEAQLPSQTDHLRLEYGHTMLTCVEPTIHAVILFLSEGRFPRAR